MTNDKSADEIVRALRRLAENSRSKHEVLTEAADLIEALQAQLAKYDEIAAEYGIDGKTMLTLAKSQIETAKEKHSAAGSPRRIPAQGDGGGGGYENHS